MANDPYHWTVEQVCDFFRQDAQRYLADVPNSRLPNLEPFLQELQENDVSGSVLLTVVDSASLRNDFGVKSLGARSAVVHCIRKLAAQSAAFGIKQEDGVAPQTPNSIADVTVAPLQHALASTLVNPPPVPVYDPSGNDQSNEHARPGEIEVQDQHGRKRRKLNLTTFTQPEPSLTSPDHGTGYFGDLSLPVDDIFLGKTQLGGEIKDTPINQEIFVLETDYHRDLAETNFQFYNVQTSAGEAQYVNRRMMPFFNAEEFALVRNGRDAVVKYPYQKAISDAVGKVQSAIVFQFRGNSDQVAAYRENGKQLDTGGDYHGMAQESDLGNWDFLQQKYDAKDGSEVLSSYHGSRAASVSSSLANEIEKEEAEAEAEKDGRKTLTREVSEAIVTQQIEKFVSEWQAKQLPRLEQTSAWTVWKRMKRSIRIRAALIEDAKARAEDFGNRLLKQKTRLAENDDWTSEGELINICESMRLTVDHREMELWKISVWQRKAEPDHVSRRGGQSSTNAQHSSTAKHQAFVPEAGDRFSVEPAQRDEVVQVSDAPQDTPPLPQSDDQGFDAAGEESEGDFIVEDLDAGSPHQSGQSDVPDASPDIDDEEPSSRTADEDMPTPSKIFSTPTKSAPDFNPDSDVSLPEAQSFIRQHSPKPVFATPTRPASAFKSKSDVIELSSDSATPSSKKARIKKSSSQKPSYDDPTPTNASAAEVAIWDMEDLVDNQDRKRIIIKILLDAGQEIRARIKTSFHKLRMLSFRLAISDALRSLKMTIKYAGTDEQSETAVFCAKLSLVWTCLKPEIMDGEFPKTIDWEAAFRDFSLAFFPHLQSIIAKIDSSLFNQPIRSSAKPANVVSLLSSDEDEEPSAKKRKVKKATLNSGAQQSQAAAFIRMQQHKEMAEQRSSNSQQLQDMISRDPSMSAVPVNPIKDDDKEFIFVDPKIAEQMKDHQKDGVQFMWRELTAVNDDEESQGCILAHTMGLGKTMQTIALLIAVNEAAFSEDPTIRQQLPPRLRPKTKKRSQLRMLVLCPVVLIQNWRRELMKWAPEKLPKVYTVESRVGLSTHRQNEKHLEDMKDWYKHGGVLLMGYPLFRGKIGRKEDAFSEHDADKLDKYLVEGTELLVADEAHNLKDEKSKISAAVKRIHTQSRIALTGTPMSNDVQEIYSLVSFAAPNYLGDPAWFRQQFAQPIREGNGRDSTTYQIRKSMKKLAVLRTQIEPKVNRADITVLRGSLKSKTEFVITLPLLGIQQAAYVKYLKALVGGGKNEKASQVMMFAWLSVLTLLCNHPLAFKRKLNAPASYKASKSKKAVRSESPVEADSGGNTPLRTDDDDSVEAVDEDLSKSVRTLGFDEATIKDITADISDDLDTVLSAKMTTLISILEMSRDCGDKVLVFTTSIPTLDYVEEALEWEGISTARIDGKVLPVVRRQTIIDNFQKDSTTALLISTRAGGVGLDIQGANRVVILDFGFNPAHEEQAVGRAYRLGQTKPVFVYRLVVGGTFEDMIQNMQLFKTSLTQRVVDKKNPTRNATLGVRDYLYAPREVPQEDLHQWMGKDELVLDKLLDRQIREQDESGGLIRHITTVEVLQEEGHDEALTAEEKLEVEQEIQLNRNTRALRKGGVGAVSRLPASTASGAIAGVGRLPPSTAPAGASIQTAHQNYQANMFQRHGFEPHGFGAPSSSARPHQGQGPGMVRLKMPPSTMPHGLPNDVPHGLPNS